MKHSPTSVNCKQRPVKVRRTLLVVDDQQPVRLAVAYVLNLSGYRVVGANSGIEAIALAAQEAIEGALIDVHMPEMDGFETCRRLQAQASRAGRPLRVWFMTGAGSAAIDRRAAALGALGVVAKPFDHPALAAWIERGFASGRLA